MALTSSSSLPPAVATFIPALTPPPGVVSNPEHPQSLEKYSNIAISISCILTTIFFAVRCYCRYYIKSTFIIEDVMATIAWAGTIVNCALVAVTMRRHGGEHEWDITADQSHEAAYWFNVVSIEYGVMIGITKITVLMLYHRVFSTHLRRWFDWSIKTLIVILALFYGITTFFKIFECSPRAKIFNMSLPGHCYNVGSILKTSGAFNAATDFVILFLPINAVYNLQMSAQKKALVILVFTFGLCAPAFATIGLVVRLQRSSSKDTSWNQPTILLWGLAELTSGNLCISFPEMGVILRARTRRAFRGTPRRPSASDMVQYKDPSHPSQRSRRKLRSDDSYMMTSLVDTVGTTKLDRGELYTALDDSKYQVKIAPGAGEESMAEVEDGTFVKVERAVSVSSHTA